MRRTVRGWGLTAEGKEEKMMNVVVSWVLVVSVCSCGCSRGGMGLEVWWYFGQLPSLGKTKEWVEVTLELH